MEGLLLPTIKDFFSELQFPQESCILQVIKQDLDSKDGYHKMLLSLSDGKFSFQVMHRSALVANYNTVLLFYDFV